jgi:hypothetical protein
VILSVRIHVASMWGERERGLWYLLCFLNPAQSKRQVSEREKEDNQRRWSSLGHEHIRVWGIRGTFEGLSSQV